MRTKFEISSLWLTAIVNCQVMNMLGVEKSFVGGTNTGGWDIARMALLVPEKARVGMWVILGQLYLSPSGVFQDF